MSLKQCIPLRWKQAWHMFVSPAQPPPGFPDDNPRLIVALAADYGNLGDVALTKSLIDFAERHLPGHRPFILPAGRVFGELRGVSRACSSEDVVAIVGGGNMGDLYPDLEEARRQVVRAFSRQRVVSFPQSMDFSNTEEGRSELLRSRRFYEQHPNLQIFARDTESLSRMRSSFPGVRVEIAPDTVLSMAATLPGPKAGNPLVMLRSDKESALSPDGKRAMVRKIRECFPGLAESDTLVQGPRRGYQDYLPDLAAMLEAIARSPVVITDRLHGMIFSAITGTACVVIPNNNHKISQLHSDWLAGQRTIRLVSDASPVSVCVAANELFGAASTPLVLESHFTPLANALKP